MTRISDILDRFRPAATPGPAGKVGVPGDRAAAAADELAPIFAALGDTVRAGDAIRSAADRAARASVRDARERARGLVSLAEREAAHEEADAAAGLAAEAAADCERIGVAAEAEAVAIATRANGLLPALVTDAVVSVAAEIASLDGPDGGGSPP